MQDNAPGRRRSATATAVTGRASRSCLPNQKPRRDAARVTTSGNAHSPTSEGQDWHSCLTTVAFHLSGPKSASTGGGRRKGGRLRAGTEGKADYNHRVLEALFVHGLDIGSVDVLTQMAREVGLD